MAAAFRVSLDANRRLLTGQKFILMVSSLHFLSRGCTKAHFQSFAKYPVSKDKLTILVNTGSNSSKHTDKIADGIRSSEHDFLFNKASSHVRLRETMARIQRM